MLHIVGISHFANPADAKKITQAVGELCHTRNFIVNSMGANLATYAGEGWIIVSF